VALLNLGLPVSDVADGTLLLSLMYSARINAYSFFGGYEPASPPTLDSSSGRSAPSITRWCRKRAAGVEIKTFEVKLRP
jgi:hypothetical protein